MGLLATEFDEEEFKREYGKVCYEDGLKDGLIEGRKEGIKKGVDNTKREIALNLYKMNLSLDFISKTTGLSIDKIKQIIKE